MTARDGLQQQTLATDASTNMVGIVPAPPPYPPNMPPLDYTGNSFAILFTSLASPLSPFPRGSVAQTDYKRWRRARGDRVLYRSTEPPPTAPK